MPGLKAMSGPSRSRAPLPSLHDVELATLAAAGDRAAFGELARRHGPGVRGLLRRMGAEPALADDLAQDAFLAAFEAIAEFRGEGTFTAWIRRIAARLYIKRWRRRSQVDLAFNDEHRSNEDAPGEGAIAQRLDLDQALSALSDAERVCVGLCYGAGLSHAQAAEALRAPLGTVKSHVKRGLEKLRRQLNPQGAPSDEEGRRTIG